jgi:hypothetical protein
MARIDPSRNQRNRARIAQLAARLIAEHGLADWSLAKRKACRQLGLSDREGLPANEEIQQALRDYNNLFRPVAHAEALRRQRRSALGWMERLTRWNPVLIGGVAAGWATEHSDVRVELEADDAKSVELALINAGVDYSPVQAGRTAGELLVGRGADTVRLVILTPQQRRNRPRRDEDQRMTLAELRSTLDTAVFREA